jgi:hypothetical protein
MNTYLARLVALVRNKLTPSANTLIANFRKMEAKIEATIASTASIAPRLPSRMRR